MIAVLSRSFFLVLAHAFFFYRMVLTGSPSSTNTSYTEFSVMVSFCGNMIEHIEAYSGILFFLLISSLWISVYRLANLRTFILFHPQIRRI